MTASVERLETLQVLFDQAHAQCAEARGRGLPGGKRRLVCTGCARAAWLSISAHCTCTAAPSSRVLRLRLWVPLASPRSRPSARRAGHA